jgi:tetratricopeptide (TPR) repeat protein
VRIGVHRGAVFAGDIGPFYRRAYTVMGDAVNLAARLMASADLGHIYATTDVLDRSNTAFEATRLEPMAVKGKAEPVQAWAVGRAQSSKARQVSSQRLPLTGRNAELGVMRKAFASARSGAGRLIEVVGDSGIGKTRLLEALRDAAAGLNKQHATCEAYTASAPYAVWSELLREYMKFGREDPETVIAERLREEVAKSAPDLVPWLPLIAVAFGLEVVATPEVEMLAQANRRAKVHESVARFLAVMMPKPQLIEIENAHHMDEASAELLSYLAGEIGVQPWLFAVARQGSNGFVAPEAETVVRIDLKPLAPQDALRLAQLATQQTPVAGHVLEVVATRSGGNPQFLRDLLQKVVDSGGIADLPDSAEAAAMAQIDSLSPEDRTVVRHASVFGLTFHPRMLAWFVDDEFSAPAPAVWDRLGDLFDQEPDGYLRFRRTLLRESAYQGLPYRLRRKLHGTIATHLEEELDYPEDMAGILSLHYFEAGDYRQTWHYATAAAKRAEAVYANVEAAGLYARALEAGRKLEDLGGSELGAGYRALGDAWYRAGEFLKASEAYAAARKLVTDEPLVAAGLLIKLSHVEAKLGQCEQALRWCEQARTILQELEGPDAAGQMARAGGWYAMVLGTEGRMSEALEWAERTVAEAEAANDPDALGDAYFVMGWAHGELGKEGGGMTFMQRSLEAYQQSGNLARQADTLSSLGAVCHWAGRWDDAISYWARGREEALKIGDTVGAAMARSNTAEILADRGEWTEAETLLLEVLPFWKASQYRYYLGHCLLYIGRVLLRQGRLDEALRHLDEAKSNLLAVGAEEAVPAVDARIAECRIAMGNADAALEVARGLLGRASESNGVARVVPLLERVQAHALILKDDLWGARDALEASLAAARERQELFEVALTSLSLIELDRREGIEAPIEMVNESRSLLASLKVRAVPPVPSSPV